MLVECIMGIRAHLSPLTGAFSLIANGNGIRTHGLYEKRV